MVILGVDFGDVRVGFARCDKTELLATGLETVNVTGLKNAAEKTAEAAKAEGAEMIVIGLPKRTDGTQGDRAERVKVFADFVKEKTGLPVELSDERFSTMHAHVLLNESNIKSKKRKGVIDTLSAQLILQSYIDRKRNTSKQ